MDQGRNRDQDRPNQNANKEPAEGSRDNVRENQKQGEGEQGGGISNRPLERELKEQEEVPPRGQTKDDENTPSDVGRTTGSGSLGHDQPDEVKRDTPLRNNATGSEDDPVMPQDDATLKTKI